MKHAEILEEGFDEMVLAGNLIVVERENRIEILNITAHYMKFRILDGQHKNTIGFAFPSAAVTR